MAYTSVRLSVAGLLAVNLIGHAGTLWSATSNSEDPLLDRGRYLAQVAGCNDCHTSGYLMSGGKVPESEWLKGDSFGWRGPWGTTYPPNLRLFMQGMSEDQWVETSRKLKRRPPMPWYTVNIMHEDDLRALYRFVVSLGDPGEPAPAFLPPGVEPTTPYALFPSPPKQK